MVEDIPELGVVTRAPTLVQGAGRERWLFSKRVVVDTILPGSGLQPRPGPHVPAEAEVALEVEPRLPSFFVEDLLGVSDKDVTKDRLYRTLDDLLKAQEPIENELKQQFGALFHITYDLMLHDLTSTYFEGLAEENDLARRGYSRDHRSDCKQVVLALVVTREGFPLAHYTLAGNVKDVQTVKKVVKAVEKRFGAAQRVWVMDRGMISKKTLAFLAKSPRKYLLATLRKEVARFQNYLGRKWQRLQEHRDIEVQPIKRGGLTYLLVRSKPRRQKERAMRRRQRRALALALRRLQEQIAAGRLKSRDKILERLGRLKGKYPRATPFVTLTVSKKGRVRLDVSWNIDKFKAALARDGVYLLRSNQRGWSAAEFWETYTQLTCAAISAAGPLRSSGKRTRN